MYLIPKNVKTRFEFFTGFGWRELLITAIGLAIGGIIFYIVSIFTDSIFALIIIALGVGGGYLISKPDPRTGQNLLELIHNFKSFKSKTHTYYYVFGEGRKK